MMGIAEFIIGPAEGRTRWLHPSYGYNIKACPNLSRTSSRSTDISPARMTPHSAIG
jgi:hypothetical protein